MRFFVAKGLEIGGLTGVAGAFYIGVTQADAIVRELGLAAVSSAVFYLGWWLEPRGT
jgi:hypothetical protein